MKSEHTVLAAEALLQDSPATTPRVPHAVLQGVTRKFGKAGSVFHALGPIDLTLYQGEFFSVVGPSGCGKSTLLDTLSGLASPSDGTVQFENREVKGVPDGVGVVFQEDASFPWLNVRDNISFTLRMRGMEGAEIKRRVDYALAFMGLKDFATAYPAQLSGGMQQRVEIARVLINQPRVLLMDEPFSALDAQTRSMMQEVLLDIWGKIPTTTVFVTHDIDEALFLADRIVVMSARPGRVIEDIVLPFARPRSHDLVTEPEFVRLKRHVMQLLRQPEGSAPLARLSPLGVPT